MLEVTLLELAGSGAKCVGGCGGVYRWRSRPAACSGAPGRAASTPALRGSALLLAKEEGREVSLWVHVISSIFFVCFSVMFHSTDKLYFEAKK